ncbi:ubiquitin-conjugating enzyme E2 [Trypanosoma grayi]|uniref:ubiquitin-conjugating enzyme E2 n=1 Tax=Trypanosoma grayi TaxID=71804 RepID=UPI0004F44BDF|nr:ubiquitin-conjugating enzyme E2 [Trypanosoma grayi]KEG13145.1 ubiquitin-conjugating enzyme E2 [Trypanosoma grayi]
MPEQPTPQCVRRLQKELYALKKEPKPFCLTTPSSRSILLWYFILSGPADTPYEGGRYFGKLVFPPNYPLKPPDIFFLTPNGRFKTDTSICLSMSSYHPEEWSPLWGVGTILTGLLSFMIEDEPTTGGVVCSLEKRKRYARESCRYNVEQMSIYKDVFPEEYQKDLDSLKQLEENGGDGRLSGINAGASGNRVEVECGEKIAQDGGAQWFGLTAALLTLLAMALGVFLSRR